VQQEMCHAVDMERTHSIPVLMGSHLEAPPEIKLLIAWDDFANGRRAICFVEQLQKDFGGMFTFTLSFLKFEDLMRPQTAAEMEGKAGEADMVIIAAYGDADLPVVVKDWMQNLGAGKGDSDSPLVVLLSSDERGSMNDRPVQWRLGEAAGRSGRNVLGNAMAWPAKRAGLPVEMACRCNRRVEARAQHAECPA
jgi:hypothetical protein